MTRTIKAIRATAITINGEGEVEKFEVQIPVENFTEKHICKEIAKCERKFDYKVSMKTIKRVEISTKMSDDEWWANCEIVGEKIVDDSDTTTTGENA